MITRYNKTERSYECGEEAMLQQVTPVGEQELTIQQVAALTQLSPYTLRYYERAGLMREPIERENSSGRRTYTSEHVRWIEFIKCLRSTGMPIHDIKLYTALVRQGDHTIQARMELLRQHRLNVEQRLREDQQHLIAINRKITFYEEVVTPYNS